MRIDINQIINKVSSNSFMLSAMQQQITMFMVTIEAMLQDGDPEIYQTYLWHSIFFQAKHLAAAESALHGQQPVDLASTQQIASHIKQIEKQSIGNNVHDAFLEGFLEGQASYAKLQADIETGKV